MTGFLERNRNAFSQLQSSRNNQSERSITCELTCDCMGCNNGFLKRPIVKAVVITVIVNGVIAAILLVFCSFLYTSPGQSIIDFTNKKPPHPNNDNVIITNSPSSIVDCPCFQSDTLEKEVIDRIDIKIDPKMSCKHNPNRKAIYFKETTTGGFALNKPFQIFKVERNNDRYTCESKNFTTEKVISEDEGRACISSLDEVCEKIEEKWKSQDQSIRQSQESHACSCFTFNDLTRPSNKFSLDVDNSCKTDNPMLREMFYTKKFPSRLRSKEVYGFSVTINDKEASCVGKDGKIVQVSYEIGRSCFGLIDDTCNQTLL